MNRFPVALCLAALACTPALAQEKRSTIDLGVSYNRYGDAVITGPTGTGVPPLAAWEVGNVTAVMLNYQYQLTPNVGLQLATTWGGSFTASGAGSLAAQGALFKATPYSGTLFLNYQFFDEGNTLRPFVGLGANYTGFSSVKSTTGQNVDMGDSWSIAAQAGARYAIDRNWSIMVSLGLNWSKSDVTISDATGTQTGRIEFRPVIFGLGVGYSF